MQWAESDFFFAAPMAGMSRAARTAMMAMTVTDAELDRAKRLMRAEFVLGHEEVSSQAITLGLYETINCYEYVSDHIARVEAVTAEDVSRATQKYLGADNRTVGYLVAEVDGRE